MKTTIKLTLSLLLAATMAAFVYANGNGNGNGHDDDHDGYFGGRFGGIFENIVGSGFDPIWDIFRNGRPVVWVPVRTNPRFALYRAGTPTNQQAVLDRSTGLVWERNSDHGATLYPWEGANDYCLSLKLANVSGWRLPTIQELASLVDYTQTAPALPNGHPFVGAFNTAPYLYWSSTTSANNAPLFAHGVLFDQGNVFSDEKIFGHKVMCVRGGQGSEIQ